MVKVGINGFGRMGRCVFRSGFAGRGLQIVQINDPAGDPATLAHLINFDSVHGRWAHEAKAGDGVIEIDGQTVTVTAQRTIEEIDWSGCDIVIDASGRMKASELVKPYFNQGVKKVIVTAPIKEESVLNVVMGVNDHLYDPAVNHLVTAASCTTNCLAPVVKVLHESIGIDHGSMTTIHAITNTQTILDAPHKDLRRARSCGQNLIPTTTGSATAITHIFPELKGRLNGHAVRVPLPDVSLTDCVFEMKRDTTVEEINGLLQAAAEGPLQGILGYEERPLVSSDYQTDPRSSIVDALSTLVVNGSHVKVYAWYDNEWGYANRVIDLAEKIAASL